MRQLIRSVNDIEFSLNDIPFRSEPAKVLLCSPDHFDIVDEKNVHMQGNAGGTNHANAMAEWVMLKETYEGLHRRNIITEVHVIKGADGCEDMVFCANQSFPWTKNDGSKVVVISNMRHESRQREVPFFEQFFFDKDFAPLHFKSKDSFEGMGDVIPHPGRQLLYGGFGHRTNASAYDELAGMLQVPIVLLELINPQFYHLDTCFVPVSENAVMICKDAFTEQGLELINHFFSTVHEIPADEAIEFFSLNAHAFQLNGHKIAVLQKGNTLTKKILEAEGYELIELETSEFMKSGGSVFCMKMMF